MKTPTARYFMRREDYQPPKTPAESPFRQFNVTCLKCGSYLLKLVGQYDEDSGEVAVILICTCCAQREILPVR